MVMGSPISSTSTVLLLPLLLSTVLLLLSFSVSYSEGTGYPIPSNCKTVECPSYVVKHSQKDFEVREYRRSVWMSTKPINSSSFKDASDTGFDYLFAYIQGKNDKRVKIEMTAPVLIHVTPSTGPFCNSTFVVYFYVPNKYQSNPPGSWMVHPVTWPGKMARYVVVRRFSGSMDDGSVIAAEAKALLRSLKGTKWEAAVKKNMKRRNNAYSVAGYNSPFDVVDIVNEVMFAF